MKVCLEGAGLTVDEAQVSRVPTGEVAAGLTTPSTRLQPLLSKHLHVVGLRLLPLVGADLKETMATVSTNQQNWRRTPTRFRLQRRRSEPAAGPVWQ